MDKQQFHLFTKYRISLEYMIVDRTSLQIKPVCNELLLQEGQGSAAEVVHGAVRWSSGRLLHVLKLELMQPESNLNTLENALADEVKRVNELLIRWNAMLLPTAAHPLMSPAAELNVRLHTNGAQLPAEDAPEWKNQQCTSLYLPFHGDAEFGRLHAAIRLILPILPALCASSPLQEGKLSGYLDTRLVHYKAGYHRLPSAVGHVIPEPVFSQKMYEEEIYQQIKKEATALNKEAVPVPASLNARAAVPDFEHGWLELRLMDVQECPAADIAIVSLVTETLKAITDEKFVPLEDQKEIYMDALNGILEDTIRTGPGTEIYSMEYSTLFGINTFTTPREIWMHIFQTIIKKKDSLLTRWEPELSVILNEGTLSERIITAIGKEASPAMIAKVYHQLSDCLVQNKMFYP